MPSRFYLPSSGSAAVSPTISADFEHINTDRKPTSLTKASTANASVAYSPDAADHLVNNDSHFRQFVSAVLQPQTFAAQTVKLQIQGSETNAGNNCFVTWKIYAVNVAGDTVLGTLLAIRRDATELTTSRVNRADSATTTQVITTEDCRLVFEVGIGGTPTGAGGVQGHNGTLWFGDDSATDLPEDDTDTTTTKNPWLEFANNLLFAASGTLAKTLGAATLASAGTVETAGISGTLAKTLDAATLVSAGTVQSAISGTLAKTLANVTLASTGTVINVPPPVTIEHAFTPEFTFSPKHGGFLAKSFLQNFVGKRRSVKNTAIKFKAEKFSSVSPEWRWPVDREWFERMEGKMDSCLERVCKLETKFEERSSLRSKLLSALAALCIAAAGYFMAGCGPFHSASPGWQGDDMDDAAVMVNVTCVYPPAPVGAEGIWPESPSQGAGSGVVVGPTSVMTARHVTDCDVEVLPNVWVLGEPMLIVVSNRGAEGKEAVVDSEGTTNVQDWAVLKTVNNARPYRVWSAPSEHGVTASDKICLAPGYPNRKVICGEVTDIIVSTPEGQHVWGGLGYYRATFDDLSTEAVEQSRPGDSGSGVYNNEGKLVGLLVGGTRDGSFSLIYSVSQWGDKVPELEIEVMHEQDAERSSLHVVE